MIPLTPALLIAAASAAIGDAQEGEGWSTEFVSRAGYRAHLDHETGWSSWPLPLTANCEELHNFAADNELFAWRPSEGDVVLVWSPRFRRHTRAGIIVSVGEHITTPNGIRYSECTTIEGDTGQAGLAGGSGVRRVVRWLRNTRYHDRPVSLYGGMVELPLIVTRDDGARYFESDIRRQLTDDRFWVEFDAERAGVGRMEQELRDNVVGDSWNGLDPAARSFIATAESVFRAHRNDAAFDFSSVVVDLAKAFEVQVNALVRQALRSVPELDRHALVNGRTVDLTTGELWSLGALHHAIAGEERVNRALKARLHHGEWFCSSLPPILGELAALRNPAAHTDRVSRADATRLRNRLLGVGGPGVIAELGRVRVK